MPIKLEPNARTIAAHVIERVYGEEGFAAAILDAALDRYPELDRRERALATELAYGTLRTAPYIEASLGEHAPRGTKKLDSAVRAHLFVAAYQVLFLERVPAFAAVSEGVRQITRARGKPLGSFANAVLRRLSEKAGTGDKRARLELAASESISRDLRDALVRSVGGAETDALVDASAPPPIGLRARWGDDRDAWVARLRGDVNGATFEPGRASPLAILVRGGGDPQKMTFFREGNLAIQEEGAQLVTLALGAVPGQTVLDACAGRGNKTALLAELVGRAGAVDAADQHPQKLARLRSELSRVDLSVRATFAVDWSVGSGDVPSSYDRVLVDAPCSGTGTIGRRPDLATRWRKDDVVSLQALQSRILVAAAERVKPGGGIVYAVCSVLREEGEEVVSLALERAPWLSPAPFAGDAARALAGDAPTLRLTPRLHGTDGYFLASLRREA